MEKYNDLNVEMMSWESARKLIPNSEIISIIDKISPGKKYKLYRARYSYGVNIVDRTGLKIPTKKGTVLDLTDNAIPKELRENLSYCSLPMGIILCNSVEVYNEVNGEVATLGVFQSGDPLGLLETLEPELSFCMRRVWNVSSGLRSAFMLPGISDRASHNRLMAAVSGEVQKPNTIADHSSIFQTIACGLKANWHVEILFFSKEWFVKKEDTQLDYDWQSFFYYLHKYLFKYTSVSRNGLTFDFVWHSFACILNSIGNKPDPHVLDTVRHLIKIAIGAMPGYAPASDNLGGPFACIREAYVELYKLQYAPVIIEPQHFKEKKLISPIYYSLHYPTMLESSPRKRKPESLVTDLIQTRSLMNNLKRLFLEKRIYLGESLINEIVSSTSFDFFHFGKICFQDIKKNEDIPLGDERFISYDSKKYSFPSAMPFVQNCIRITRNKILESLDLSRIS
jgi:hypothetical protein